MHVVAHGPRSILTVRALALVGARVPAHAQETWQVSAVFDQLEFAGLNARGSCYLEAYEPA